MNSFFLLWKKFPTFSFLSKKKKFYFLMVFEKKSKESIILEKSKTSFCSWKIILQNYFPMKIKKFYFLEVFPKNEVLVFAILQATFSGILTNQWIVILDGEGAFTLTLRKMPRSPWAAAAFGTRRESPLTSRFDHIPVWIRTELSHSRAVSKGGNKHHI